MVIRARTNRRRRTRRPRRKMNISRPLRTMAKRQVYAFSRHVNALASLTGSDAVPLGNAAVTFKLNDVTNSSEFTSLFDRYKLAGVAYRWVMTVDPMVLGTKSYPRLNWVYDYDDSSTPTGLTDLLQYPKMKEFWFTDNKQSTPWKFFKPSRLNVGYESATLSSYEPTWKGFIDCASDAVPHYGIKLNYSNLRSGVSLFLQCKYYLTFKNVR